MADKRIEVVQTDAKEATGRALVRVLDVKTKPTDVRFRIGYRYTNEWLGQDGFWRRSMTMIEPQDWRHENDVLELTIGPEVQSSIEPNQPIRIEVPGVDAGQVVLWPSDLDTNASSGAATATEAAIASLTAEKTAADAPSYGDGAPSNGAEAAVAGTGEDADANSETRAAQARAIAAAQTIATGHGSPASRMREKPPLAPRPPQRSTPPTEAELDAELAGLVRPSSDDPMIPTSVRGSTALDRVDAPAQKRRSLTRRRRHPKRAYHGDPGLTADVGTIPIPSKNAIVPAPHYNTSADEVERAPQRDGQQALWRLPLAIMIGLGAGAGGYAAYQATVPGASIDPARLIEIERRLAEREAAAAAVAQAPAEGEARLADLTAENASLRAEISELTEQVGASAPVAGESEQVAALADALQSLEAENAELVLDLEAALAKLPELEQRAATAERSLTEQSAAFLVEKSTLASQLDETRSALETARLDIETAREARDAAEALIEGAEIERNQAQAQAADLQFSIARLEAEITQMADARDVALSRVATLEQAATDQNAATVDGDQARAELSTAQTELAAARQEVETLSASLETLRQERDAATQRAAEASAEAGELASLRAERDELRRSLDTERTERAAVEQELAATEAEISDAEATAQENRAGANQRALTALNAAEIARAEAIEATEIERARVQELSAELAAMRADLETARAASSDEAEAAELRTALAETQRAREMATIEATAARAEIAALQTQLAELEDIEPAMTEAQASQLREAAARAERQNSQAQAEIAALRRQVASLSSQTRSVPTAATIPADPSRTEAAIDTAFTNAGDLLPTRSIQRSKLRMRLMEGEQVFSAVRGELGLRYSKFDELVDSLCESLPEQCG